MKTVVDADLCIGCELCTSTVPEVYHMDGSVSVAIDTAVPAALEDDVTQAKDDCPVGAISVE